MHVFLLVFSWLYCCIFTRWPDVFMCNKQHIQHAILLFSVTSFLNVQKYVFWHLQECLCLLVVDDSEEVASSAQEFLECLFSSDRKEHVEHDIMEILNRFCASTELQLNLCLT